MSRSAVVMDIDRFDEAERGIEVSMGNVMRFAGQSVEGRAKEVIIEVDAIITGDLYRSVGSQISVDGRTVEVVATMPYAKFVHDGTEHMRARPFLEIAVRDMQGNIERYAVAHIGRALT